MWDRATKSEKDYITAKRAWKALGWRRHILRSKARHLAQAAYDAAILTSDSYRDAAQLSNSTILFTQASTWLSIAEYWEPLSH